MKVKGSSLLYARDFVKENFGAEGYKKWIEALPEASRKMFSTGILSTEWYPLTDGLTLPTKKVCELFYNGDTRGSWEMGKYSADKGLKGIYRFFVKLGSPEFIAKKASTILPTYYQPSRMTADMLGNNKASVKIIEFSEIADVIESRVGGWIEKALEVSGNKSAGVTIAQALSKGDKCTEYMVEWE